MKILVFGASLRKESYNRKLAAIAAGIMKEAGEDVKLVDFRDYLCPMYDGDMETSAGIPEGAKKFAQDLIWAQGLVISSPEYNFSVPGTLKNLIDWASRIKPDPFGEAAKVAKLLSTSPGFAGGIRGLWQLRIPLEGVGLLVHPEMFPLPQAKGAFTPEGALADPKRMETLRTQLESFLQLARKIGTP